VSVRCFFVACSEPSTDRFLFLLSTATARNKLQSRGIAPIQDQILIIPTVQAHDVKQCGPSACGIFISWRQNQRL